MSSPKQDVDSFFQQRIIDGIAEPVMLIGEDYDVRMMNRAAWEFSAIETDSTNKLHCYQVSHRRDLPCEGSDHPCPLQMVKEVRQPITVVHEHYTIENERRFIEIVAAPYFGEDGTFQGIIETNRDITEKKEAEHELKQYTDRLRLLSAQLVEVEDAERLRLSRELHDQVGQNLSALGINLKIICNQLTEDIDPQVLYRLDDSIKLVEQIGEQIRGVMAHLRPPVLDDYGLVAALRWYGNQFSHRTGVKTTIISEDSDPRLDARLENALFRITLEALTNVAKHAKANHVCVTLDIDNEILNLEIVDDGIGFETPRRSEFVGDQGWGLLTMTERAEAVGGQCRIESTPKQGTRVMVKVPQ